MKHFRRNGGCAVTAPRADRRLAAVLAADVVGYSRLMEQDERGTFERLKAHRREMFEPLIGQFHGRIVKLMGDGALCEFRSIVEAVSCAVLIQQTITEREKNVQEEERIRFRIGINLGDVIHEQDGDLYGDGVNIAARLEALAEPGSVCISGTAYDHLRGKLECTFEYLGERVLKNIEHPVRVYQAMWTQAAAPTGPPALAMPDRPSIAVLPFNNMSSDPEQEYFGDGLAEDLITDLSRIPGFVVIARHSSFAYKGKAVDIRTIAKDLGVRYVIEGSVRRDAGRVRISAQIIDAVGNIHIWASRFDRDLESVFALQDEIVGRIVSALSGLLPPIPPIIRQRATNLEAYDLFVRGRALVNQSVEGNRPARQLLERSITLDPDFADAYAWLAMGHLCGRVLWGEVAEPHFALALAAAERAVSLDPDNAGAHAVLGDVLLFHDRPAGVAELATALAINPNHADAWVFLGEARAYEGHAVEGIAHTAKAFGLNPYPPGWYYWYLGYVEYAAGRYEDAVNTLRHESTHRLGSQRILAAGLAQLGRVEEARAEAQQFLVAHPLFSIQSWAGAQPFQHEADRQKFIDGYLKAGLPM
jgi:TolB-like protein